MAERYGPSRTCRAASLSITRTGLQLANTTARYDALKETQGRACLEAAEDKATVRDLHG